MIYTFNEILFSLKKKERNPAIGDNSDEPGEHYAKQNKPDSTDTRYLKSKS